MPRFSCPACDRWFRSERGLARHVAEAHLGRYANWIECWCGEEIFIPGHVIDGVAVNQLAAHFAAEGGATAHYLEVALGVYYCPPPF